MHTYLALARKFAHMNPNIYTPGHIRSLFQSLISLARISTHEGFVIGVHSTYPDLRAKDLSDFWKLSQEGV